MSRQKGQTLLELMVSIAVLGSIALIANTTVGSARKRIALAGATSELRSTIMYVRMLAIARDRNVAIRFRSEAEGWTWTVYEDGDGDGVRNDDIQKGKDRQVRPTSRFQSGPAGIGLPTSPVSDPLASGKVLSDRSPVRFNASMLCSFTRQGEVTNGSVVLSDGTYATIVRVHDTTGRIEVWRWNGKGWKTGA